MKRSITLLQSRVVTRLWAYGFVDLAEDANRPAADEMYRHQMALPVAEKGRVVEYTMRARTEVDTNA